MEDRKEVISKLDKYANRFMESLPHSLSASLYLYQEAGYLYLSITIIETSANNIRSVNSYSDNIKAILGPTILIKTVDRL